MISYSQEVTTYYFIRHAEKLRIDKTDKNPNLNYNGYKRAEAWKDVFSNISFDAVYSTDYNRTKFINYKNSSELTLEQKQKIFGYGKMNLEAALQDMSQDQIDELQEFANQRKNLINQISSQQKTTNNKFMNSIDKEKILF